ncbi:hypothetical protein ANCCAN_06345 [Ancylostoma caninum]|uniref:Uncharacterized protein n=1 Tax=Ancylostoma caninum TaxID=29170 RepID=A0A368GT80_ANCCA|nr:hypothetical protein ANCCAN_06345 [Ancylostoma caninum]
MNLHPLHWQILNVLLVSHLVFAAQLKG